MRLLLSSLLTLLLCLLLLMLLKRRRGWRLGWGIIITIGGSLGPRGILLLILLYLLGTGTVLILLWYCLLLLLLLLLLLRELLRELLLIVLIGTIIRLLRWRLLLLLLWLLLQLWISILVRLFRHILTRNIFIRQCVPLPRIGRRIIQRWPNGIRTSVLLLHFRLRIIRLFRKIIRRLGIAQINRQIRQLESLPVRIRVIVRKIGLAQKLLLQLPSPLLFVLLPFHHLLLLST
mmetsp:Transcript_29012/g.60394  ORF Transcript_29012/g.60394 Transcript_29012/m.60394 type:complete len:233 (-) Transcript_29012:1418-2116(-)